MNIKNEKKQKVFINESIRADQVRTVDSKGEQLGVLKTSKALELAKKQNLDLVEISPNATPPVCKIMDFGKFLYEQKKRTNDAKKKQKQTQVKTIKYRPGTEESDYQVKFRNIVKFLENGDKVKVGIWFRGREMTHRDIGLEILKRIKEETKEFANVEQEAKIEGRQLGMMLAPKSKK
ncbi:Translation initiation factor 3 [hydrothermal vent metagenome]|uniref:Translation initiation factor 3 n=1 Tax=hydrothermal vent metagenome TaxID=652676 RepID=A0A1W1C1Q8_9ZZZZ